MVETIRITRPSTGPLRLGRTMTAAAVFTAAGLAVASISLAPAPAVDDGQTIGPGFVASSAQTFAPSVELIDRAIALPRLASTAEAFAPSVSTGAVAVDLAFVPSTVIAFAPEIGEGVVPSTDVALPIIPAATAVFSPTVTAGAIDVDLPLLISSQVTYSPAIAPGPVAVGLDPVPAGAQTFEVVIGVDGSYIVLPLIPSNAAAFDPSVTAGSVSISVPFIASTADQFSPSVIAGDVGIVLPYVASSATAFDPSVLVGAATVDIGFAQSTAQVFNPVFAPGAVGLQLGFVASGSAAFAPSVAAGPVAVQVGFVASSSTCFEPTIAGESSAPWYETDPSFERAGFIMDAAGQRVALWNGQPYGPTGMIPKRDATWVECFLITAAAGRSYVPLEGLPYLTDTAANAPLFDGTNGRWQFTTDPVPRFNRLFPSALWSQAQTLQLLQWDYVISGYWPIGTGIDFDGPSITGGHFELRGQGENVKVWGIIPHPSAGDVVITPVGGPGRFVNLDTHGQGGYDPDYPTQWIPTTTERVDRAGDDIRFTEAVRTLLINPEGTYQGTIVVQGQFFGPARVAGEGMAANRRVAIGWDNTSHIGVDVNGNAVCNTGAGVPLSTPLGSGGNGDPFRLVLSFRDRDDVGGFRDGYDGVRRLAGNGGAAVEHTGKYNGGTGWITRLQFARTPFTFGAEDCGAGRYDFVMISPDLMTLAQVEALSD